MNLDFELKRRDDEERRIFTEIIIPRDSRARFRDRPARKIFKLRGSELPPLPQSVSVRYPSSRSIASRFILAVHFLKKRKHGSRRNWPLTFQSRVNNTTKHPPLCVISIGLSSLPRQGLTLTKPSSTINLLSLPLFFEEREGREIEETGKVSNNPLGTVGADITHTHTHTHVRIQWMDGFGTRSGGGETPVRAANADRGGVPLDEGGDRWKKRVTGRRIGDDSWRERVISGVLDWSIPYFPRSANRKMELVRPEDSTKADYWPTLLRLQMFRRDTILRSPPTPVSSLLPLFTLESASLRHATRPTHERDPVARVERDDRIRIGTTSSRVESRLLSTIDSRGKGGRERADAICEMRRLIIQAFTPPQLLNNSPIG